jgi:multiple sugar transport system permease protein
VVLGLRRPVLPRAAHLRLRPDRVERLAELLRRPQHRDAHDVRGVRQLRRHAVRPRLPVQHADLPRLRRVHRPDDARAVSGAGAVVHRPRWFQPFFRSVFFLPTACSYVVASLVWKMSIFSGVPFGLANTVLGWLGMAPTPWLSVTQPPWYWLVIVTVRLWLQVGFYMILFLAALQRISPTLYEAAAIDGAIGWKVLRHITVPQLATTSSAVLLLLLVNAFQAFDEFYNLALLDRAVPAVCASAPRVPLLHRARSGSGRRPRERASGHPHTVIAVVAIGQGRLMRFGRED